MNFIGILAGIIIYSRTHSFLFAIASYFLVNYIVSQFTGQQKSNNNQRRYRGFQQQYQQQNSNYYQKQISQKDFTTALLVLSASVMKSDGKPLKSELNYVKRFFNKQFSPEFAQQQMIAFRDILKKNFDIEQVCNLIKRAQPPHQRSVLIQYLFGIAQADGTVSEAEVQTIARIAALLDISRYEFEQLKAMFYNSSYSNNYSNNNNNYRRTTNAYESAADAYKTLGITKSATNEEIKKAYRKMAVKNHPDKFAQMGEEYQKAAKEKFQKIQDAYENIKKERGIK